jgi:hypothetical protein
VPLQKISIHTIYLLTRVHILCRHCPWSAHALSFSDSHTCVCRRKRRIFGARKCHVSMQPLTTRIGASAHGLSTAYSCV